MDGSDNARFVAEMIAHLVRLSDGVNQDNGLTSAQWAALRYFGHATAPSRTLSAFADYHVTTRGTASQTVKSLVGKGLLKRTRSQTDRRSSRIDLTAKGRALCKMDPFDGFVQTIEALTQSRRSDLMAILEPLMSHVSAARQKPRFGLCSTCQYLRHDIDAKDAQVADFCRLTKISLARSDLKAICMNYRSAATRD